MARLSENQVLQLLKKPKNSGILQRCIEHEQRLEMHVKPLLSKGDSSPALSRFLESVRAILPADKYQKFEQLVPYPLPTVEISNTIFTALGRVFEAQDSLIKGDFVSPELEADFQEYREQIRDTEFWQNDGFDALKKALHSVVICDLPAIQESDLPDPYYYLLHVSRIHDIEVNKLNQCEYIIFSLPDDEEGNQYFAVFDEAFYSVYKRLKDKQDHFLFAGPIPHGLGYCPAKPFWNVFLDKNTDHIQKEGPITALLGLFDDYLFWEISFKYYQLYGAFPILWEYPSECDYEDQEGNRCQGGFVDSVVNNQSCRVECPTCRSHPLTGPGSIVQKPMPLPGTSDIGEPVGFVNVPVDILNYQTKRQRERKEEIKIAAIGRDAGVNSATKTEVEVFGTFETKDDIINGIQGGFEEIHKWTLETISRLKWGESFIGATVNYGTQRYLKNAEEYQEEYKASKEAGVPMYILSTVRHSVNAAKYRNNPGLLERSEILANLEPYPDLTITELLQMKAQTPGLVKDEELILKLNFDSYIKRFEREQLPVQQVASVNVTFDKKITLIQNKLFEYVREQNQSAAAPGA